MTHRDSGILCRVFTSALRLYFDSDRRAMARALRCKPAELEQALSQPGAHIGFALFERLVVHCLSNGLSVDALLPDSPDGE